MPSKTQLVNQINLFDEVINRIDTLIEEIETKVDDLPANSPRGQVIISLASARVSARAAAELARKQLYESLPNATLTVDLSPKNSLGRRPAPSGPTHGSNDKETS